MTEEEIELNEIGEGELPQSAHSLWLKTVSAVEMSNHKYAVSLAQAVLKEAPGFVEGRRLLRKSAVMVAGPKSTKKSFFGSSGGGLGTMKLKGQSKKDPEATLVLIEKELEKNPYDPEMNDLLHDTAMRLNMLDTASFALETIRQTGPENTKLLHKLAEFYMNRDMPQQAEAVYNDIVKQDSTDIDAVKGAKDASARASMQKQKYGQDGDFKDNLKSTDEAKDLEKSSQTGMTQDQLEEKRDRLLEKYEENQNDLVTAKELGTVYESLEDWENSHAFFEWAFSLSNNDNSLRQKAAYMKDKLEEYKISQMELEVTADPESEEKRQMLEEMKSTRVSKQVEEAQRRVEMNPTDPQNRYELGLALLNAGEHSDAIPHLQQATRSPHIRTRVLLVLARCFDAKGMGDLAIKQLEDANADLQVMDSTKKEVLYELGEVSRKYGNPDKALLCFKEIYEVDYGYRDVAQRVEDSYSG